MVKIPDAPVARVMAGGAIRSQSALVYILPAMACQAFLACILELRARMAGIALDRKMPAREWESGAAMVEIGRLPRCLGVAAFAIRSFLTGVAVVLLVAGNTFRGGFLPESSIDMAGLARHGGVASAQGILREIGRAHD